jgi:hypothetical protein
MLRYSGLQKHRLYSPTILVFTLTGHRDGGQSVIPLWNVVV